jgi:hypothetical protein
MTLYALHYSTDYSTNQLVGVFDSMDAVIERLKHMSRHFEVDESIKIEPIIVKTHEEEREMWSRCQNHRAEYELSQQLLAQHKESTDGE